MAEKRDDSSREEVAYKLFWQIAFCEGKRDVNGNNLLKIVDRKWILNTYDECLQAVCGKRTGTDYGAIVD